MTTRLFTLMPLALAATTVAAHAAPLTQTQTLARQVLLPVGLLSVSDTSADNAAPVLSQNTTPGFSGFDTRLGVLTGVHGTLQVDTGHGLMAYRTESGGQWTSEAKLRATWSLAGQVLSTGLLAQAVSDRDTLVVTSTQFNTLSFNASSNLDRFVGNGPLAMNLNTAISAFINDGGGGSVAIASVLDTTGPSPGPDLDGLSAGLQWGYDHLRHAQMSFSAAGRQDGALLDLASGSASFSLHALGDAATTGADLVGWSCSGDCSSFSLGLAGFDGLAAGASVSGLVQALNGSTPAAARYTFLLRDDDAIGAAASRAGHQLTLDVAVNAVPEPQSWALMLAGLLWLGRRRLNRG